MCCVDNRAKNEETCGKSMAMGCGVEVQHGTWACDMATRPSQSTQGHGQELRKRRFWRFQQQMDVGAKREFQNPSRKGAGHNLLPDGVGSAVAS